MEQTSKKAQPNQPVQRVKLFKTNKGWMTAGITTMALAAGVVTFAGTNNASAATWKARSVADIVDQIKTATTKSTYTIKWGDTLETIAQALEQTGIKTSADRLAEINHIAKADVIYAGNKLTFTGTGSTAVATVKQSDGTKKSYNLDPNKQAQASTKDVQEAKQSQQKVAAKAAPVVQAKADTTKTSTAAKTTDTAAKSDDAKAATDTAATTDDNATAATTTDSSAKFEQAVKDAGYTYTKTDDGQYVFELTSGSASDAAAIKQLASDNQVTNYEYTDSKLTALTADLQAIGVQVKSASGAYTFTAKNDAQASAAKKLIAASGLSSKYSLTLVQADATSENAASTQAAQTTDDSAATKATTTTTAATTATKAATTSAAATTTAKTATTSAATTTPAKTTTSNAAAKTTTVATKTTTTAASTTPVKTSTTAKTTTTAAKTTTTAAKTTATTTTTKTSSSASRTAKINAVIALAKKQLGKPYSWGAKGPSSFDCSGLMYYVFLNATGKNIGGYTVPQESAGTQVSVSNLQAGDLVFWGSHGNTYHVALYLGGGQYLEAPKPGYNVRISTLSSYFMPSFGVRVF
jgi:cell wall-associated NlpC family hydrolase